MDSAELKNRSIDEQLDFLMEGSYFADEGGLGAAATSAADQAAAAGAATGLRAQMRTELKSKLEKSAQSGEPLRAYIGVDPTRTSLHIGHMVPVSKLARFQKLGHTVVFLIGDYTATIGDPTGQNSEREALSHERVLELSKFYTAQAYRLLEPAKTEIRYNSEWLESLGFAQVAELLAQFPLAQVLAREDFRSRMEKGGGLRAHELLYSVMQGYDAYALNCDVQVGGYDQHFNLLAGRVLQEHFKRKYKDQPHPLFAGKPETGKWVKGPHVMLTFPLLLGTDGRKMSKSWDNTIDVLSEPKDMYGRVMRISDEMIENYLSVAVEAPRATKAEILALAESEPLAAKKWVAHFITAMYNGAAAADEAAEHFRAAVQEKQLVEDDIVDVAVPVELQSGETLAGLIAALKLAGSKKEAQRLIEGGGVRINGEVVVDKFAAYSHSAGALLQLGKRKVYRLN
jgi:tyrosyl-tRNA synthetase